MSKDKIYVVTMYRWGDRERHSYVYGVFTKKNAAIEAGKIEQVYRGGNKYYPQVMEFTPNTTMDHAKEIGKMQRNEYMVVI
jgi:hypothetical protein